MIVGEKGIRKHLWIAVFLLPSLIGLGLFKLLPILCSMVLTLFRWDLLTPPQFVFMQNFNNLIADEVFWSSLAHTLYYIAGYVPMVIVVGLALALVMNQRLKGVVIFRTAYFIPVVSSWAAVALLWKWIFNPRFGLLNYILGLIGIYGPSWIFDPLWAMPAIIITSVWKDLGFIMTLFLAGLQGIPEIYYNAASIDGAGSVRKFFAVTVPLLSPTTFFALTISLIHSFQVFDQVWIMTQGGPAGATAVLVEQIYKNATAYNRMGYASALSWVLFLLVFSVTGLQMIIQRKWVHYD